MIIGFDFDKVFINYPPFIPDYMINFFYRRGLLFFLNKKKKRERLLYRFPGTLEQKIRVVSHAPLFRSEIKENVTFIKRLRSGKKHKMYLISSRYGFLKGRTNAALTKYRLHQFFSEIHFNYENQQPHLFKEEKLKKLKVNAYVDDDLPLILYLAQKLPKIKLYWLSQSTSHLALPKNVKKITCLFDINDI